jgi:hypothetical protein
MGAAQIALFRQVPGDEVGFEFHLHPFLLGIEGT